ELNAGVHHPGKASLAWPRSTDLLYRASPSGKIVAQNPRMIVALVPCSIDQRDILVLQCTAEPLHLREVRVQFLAIAIAEFRKPRRIVAEPLAQHWRRRDVLEPFINCGIDP